MPILFLLYLPARAKIVRIQIDSVQTYENGRVFGEAGVYERIYGVAYGEVDPNHPGNTIIQDIELAPRNENGLVEYYSEIVLLRPKDMSKSNGLLFISLPNRGNVFPPDPALLERGYVYLWPAWQGDVLPGNNRVTMKVPVATNNGETITGPIRAEFQVLRPAQTLNLSTGAYTGMTHHSYETVSLDNSGLALTKRVHEADARVPVSNDKWAFADCTDEEFPGKPSTTQICLEDGFDPNYIYELVYTGKDPLVLGLGFAAVRDIASFFEFESTDNYANVNPLMTDGNESNPIEASIMQGVSQCSNFVRTFLHLGFNRSETGQHVFDGVNAHIAPRRISLNIRFGRPGGGGLQHEDHWFPSNEPPFTWDDKVDPVSGITGGILEKCTEEGNCPKVMQTLSSSGFWQLRASLTLTDPYGLQDYVLPDNVRVYHFAGTQHAPFGMMNNSTGFNMNYNSYYPNLRALIIALEKWVMSDELPPDSKYPTIVENTLVRPNKTSTGWPAIPGVPYNGLVNKVPLLDFGPDFSTKYTTGITWEPPTVIPGKSYTVLVPRVNEDGNEVGSIQNVNMRVPVGTYTGWSLRKEGFGKGDLSSLNGMFIPFAKTKKERLANNDPRLSLEERYHTHLGYVEAVKKAARDLVEEGFLLPGDAQQRIENAEQSSVLKNE